MQDIGGSRIPGRQYCYPRGECLPDTSKKRVQTLLDPNNMDASTPNKQRVSISSGKTESQTETGEPSHRGIQIPPTRPSFTSPFFAKGDVELEKARAIYFKAYIGGTLLVIIAIFAVFSIYWGSLYKVPERPLHGWVVVRGHY